MTKTPQFAPLATILHNEDHRDDDDPRRVELALGPDGDVWARDPGGEWYPTGTSRDETPDSVLDVIATAWRGPNWDLEWIEQE